MKKNGCQVRGKARWQPPNSQRLIFAAHTPERKSKKKRKQGEKVNMTKWQIGNPSVVIPMNILSLYRHPCISFIGEATECEKYDPVYAFSKCVHVGFPPEEQLGPCLRTCALSYLFRCIPLSHHGAAFAAEMVVQRRPQTHISPAGGKHFTWPHNRMLVRKWPG